MCKIFYRRDRRGKKNIFSSISAVKNFTHFVNVVLIAYLIAYLIVSVNIYAQEGMKIPAKVSVSFPAQAMYEAEDITGVVTIVRTPDQKVDVASFAINGVPLSVEEITTSQKAVPEGLVVSRYQFVVPKRKAGLYLFPAVEVNVGGMKVTSVPVSFEVLPTVSSQTLRLEATLSSTPPFYPGQPIIFTYRIFFQEPIELTREELPLLFVTGFRNSGAPKITSFIRGGDTVQEINQEAICLAPGTFEVKPSRIEGYVYKVNPIGERTRTSTLLRADAPGFSITVSPFPEKGKPASFTGALGQFDWRARLVGPASLSLGDEVKVEIVVSGTGELETVELPNIAQQPAFSSFRLSDIPAVGKVENGTKQFVIEMRPLSSDVTAVPSIEFSSFDPFSQSYIVKKTNPLPLTIKKEKSNEAVKEEPQEAFSKEIYGNMPVAKKDIQIEPLQPTILFIILLALFALCLFQFVLKKRLSTGTEKVLQSRDLLYQALQVKHKPDEACSLIQKALLLRLHEVGYTHELVKVPQDLRDEGIEGEIRRFLLTIDQKRFAGLELDTEMKEIIKEASELYHRLGRHL